LSEVCDEYSIAPTQCQQWQKTLLSSTLDVQLKEQILDSSR